VQYMKQQYSMLIGERTAEDIKIQLASAYPLAESLTMEVKGRDLVSGIPKTLYINDTEIREALSDVCSSIVQAVRNALESTPPELSSDIVDRGIVLAGGGSLLKGLDLLLRDQTGLPVMYADDPLSAVANGTGKVLDELDLLSTISLD
ncbi:MAG: rod shape-determining protein, partial [SAR324 cluster bacterium]|nr:rod shape-determining protein [SAR324 cluster bacterium]